LAYLAAVVGVWLLLQQAERWWLATILMFSPRWLFALPLLVLVPAALLVRSRSIVALLAAALIVGWPVMGFNVPWPQFIGSAPNGIPFRVLTLNMHYNEAAPEALEEFIATHGPDVVAIQEWPGSQRSALTSAPDWHVHATPRLFLASRYPIRAVVELGDDSMGEHASAAHYELDTPAGPVHVFSLHTATTRQGIADTLHEKRKGPGEVQTDSDRRREQSAFVAGQAAACRETVLVLGDFNTPPESPIFPEVWAGYTDTFSAAGWGWGYTFFGAHTAVRIDHILARKGWHCADCRVGPEVGSPHRPVIAELVWSGGSARRE
jgi:endonuclease/exonuclease/phosphatase (EEP) superfamily protein YafD